MNVHKSELTFQRTMQMSMKQQQLSVDMQLYVRRLREQLYYDASFVALVIDCGVHSFPKYIIRPMTNTSYHPSRNQTWNARFRIAFQMGKAHSKYRNRKTELCTYYSVTREHDRFQQILPEYVGDSQTLSKTKRWAAVDSKDRWGYLKCWQN